MTDKPTPRSAAPGAAVAPAAVPAPPGSRVAGQVPGAHFWDAWAVPAARPELTALEQFLRVARQTPAWIERLMALRNRVVSALGLKDLGGLSHIDPQKAAADYRPGDRVGIFTLVDVTPDEVRLGDHDRHLNVVVSVHRAPPSPSGAVVVTVTTVVRIHNLLGHLYMLPVRPAHRVIARAMTATVGRRLPSEG